MRGTLSSCCSYLAVEGIIPAHAGNTLPVRFTTPRRRDHPRACGEHFLTKDVERATLGSSPRMRGTHHGGQRGDRRHGIIPAHAGNTIRSTITSAVRRDHPRACGEHFNRMSPGCGLPGSSPRMRGTPSIHPTSPHCRRIIPAHAGNTANTGWRIVAGEDHPRACGEHALAENKNIVIRGSSPRMRGTRATVCEPKTRRGIIPAHAGNTISWPS